MSQLTPAERAAFARDLLRVLERFEGDVAAVCLKHTMAPSLFADLLDFEGLKRELQQHVAGRVS